MARLTEKDRREIAEELADAKRHLMSALSIAQGDGNKSGNRGLEDRLDFLCARVEHLQHHRLLQL